MSFLSSFSLTRPSSAYQPLAPTESWTPMHRRIGHRHRTTLGSGLKARTRATQLFKYAPSTPRRFLPRSWSEVPLHGERVRRQPSEPRITSHNALGSPMRLLRRPSPPSPSTGSCQHLRAGVLRNWLPAGWKSAPTESISTQTRCYDLIPLGVESPLIDRLSASGRLPLVRTCL